MRYWLTPPHIYDKLDAEFDFDFDPCPHPLIDGYDGLAVPWHKSNFVNPPFRRKEALGAKGPTAFARKVIYEHEQGNGSVLLLPVNHYVNLLLEAGAEVRSMGRVPWLECDTKEAWKSPVPIAAFILKGKR